MSIEYFVLQKYKKIEYFFLSSFIPSANMIIWHI